MTRLRLVLQVGILLGFALCGTLTLAKPQIHPVTKPKPAAVAPATTDAEAPPATNQGRVWNLQDADILSIINEISLETGKNFIVDPRVSGKISLISSKPLHPDEVYQVFLSVLGQLGYSAIPSGDVIKVVPNMESTEMATRVATTQTPGHGDEIVVRIIPLENVSATQLLPILRPLLPQWGNISAYVPGNVLIAVGRAANLQRIMDVIQEVDVASSNHVDLIRLHHASAAQVVTVLNNLQSAARANGDNAVISIAADERSNAVLLSGSQAARQHMRQLVNDLDAPAGAQGNTDVVYLRYLQAKNLAPILGKIADNILHSGNSATPDTNGGISDIHVNSHDTGGGSKSSGGKSGGVTTNIQAEPNTNALIITAPPALMQSLKTIVSKLDIRPAQVSVEAIIVEINQDDLNNLGIQWGGMPSGSSSNTSPTTSSIGFPALGAGNLGIIPATQVQAILSMLENKNSVNVLSTPSIVVLDNQKATLKVGQNVPQQNGSYATTGSTSTVTPYNTITNLPVVLQLDVTPQINLGNSVRLKVKLKNDTLQNPQLVTLNPTVNTSQIDNTVIVNSEDVLVIGGLISNTLTDAVNKVPILGDLPIVGYLFQQHSHEVTKKNLVAFIRPVILHNAEQNNAITHSKYDDARNNQLSFPEDLLDETSPKSKNILPLWKNKVQLPQPFST